MISTDAAAAVLGAPAEDSTLLEGMIERATDTLERDLGFYLREPAARVVEMQGGAPMITLADDVLEPSEEAPIAIAYLTPAWEWETIPATQWRRDGRRFMHRVCFPPAPIRFTYRSGWAVDTGPGHLRDLVLRLVALRYRDDGSDGIQSETLSDYSYTLKSDKELAESWAETVRRYSRRLPI